MRMVRRRRSDYGEAIDLDAVIKKYSGVEKASTYGDVHKVTRFLKKIHSGEQLSSLYSNILEEELEEKPVLRESDIIMDNLRSLAKLPETLAMDLSPEASHMFGFTNVGELLNLVLDTIQDSFGSEALVRAYEDAVNQNTRFFYFIDNYEEVIDTAFLRNLLEDTVHYSGADLYDGDMSVNMALDMIDAIDDSIQHNHMAKAFW